MGMNLPGIVIGITADTASAVKSINAVNAKLGDSLGPMAKFKGAVDKAFVPALATVTALGVAAVGFMVAAGDDAKAAAILATALKKSTGASDAQIASTEEWISQQGRVLGIADDDIRPALGVLARATGDVTRAQSLASTAFDVSAATGKDLTSVANALAKAQAGSTTSLGKLVPGLDKAILASGDMVAIQAELARVMGGSAATAAGTAAGQMQTFQVALGEAGENIGAALLPALAAVMPYIQSFGTWAQNNTTTILIVAGAIAVLAGVVIALKVAMTVMTAVQWLLNTAMLANPITWIVLAIIAFIAAIVLAYNNVGWFRDMIQTAWAAIQTAVGVVVDWFVANVLPTLKTVWEGIQIAVAAVVAWFQEYVQPVLEKVIGFIVGYFKAYFTAVKFVWDKLYEVIGVVVGWIRDYVAPVISTAVEVIGYVFGVMYRAGKLAWDTLRTAIQPFIDWFVATVVPIIKTQLGFISTAFEAVKTVVVNVWNGITTFLGGIVDKFLTIGGQIVQGIKDGFSAPWNAFVGWIQDKINSLPDAAKKVLGINSPSLVFKSIGESVVEGWAAGLAGMSGVNAALLKDTSRTLATLDAGVGYGSTASSGAGAGATVVVNVTGAIDPVATAQQIKRILAQGSARVGAFA